MLGWFFSPLPNNKRYLLESFFSCCVSELLEELAGPGDALASGCIARGRRSAGVLAATALRGPWSQGQPEQTAAGLSQHSAFLSAAKAGDEPRGSSIGTDAK